MKNYEKFYNSKTNLVFRARLLKKGCRVIYIYTDVDHYEYIRVITPHDSIYTFSTTREAYKWLFNRK